MYQLIIKPILFLFSPELSHSIVCSLLKVIFTIPGVSGFARIFFHVEGNQLEKEVFGLRFKNQVGLAAGFDKNGKYVNELSNFGFSFIEIGTVTPEAQPGNEKVRIFRLKKDGGIINRMGFNNEGAVRIAKRLKSKKHQVIIGGNIGKNRSTPPEKAIDDYEKGFQLLFDHVDYFVINISSPNTPGVRDLQEKKPLNDILSRLQELNLQHKEPKPILIKIAPDLTTGQLDDIIEIMINTKIQGVIATNTTISRDGLSVAKKRIDEIGEGGLSGKPVKDRSTEVIKYLKEHSNGHYSIIGVGGIHAPEDAIEKINAGASLVQIYTGFIYEGPYLVKRINKKLLESINSVS